MIEPQTEGRGATGRPALPTRFYLASATACSVVAVLSLLIPSTITYDPFAWAGWAREILHFHLDTRTGPAWKPLPVLFDLPFAAFGRTVLWAWLVLARAGGLLSVVLAYKLAARLAGRAAGLFAAVGVVTSTSWLFYLMAVGLSEPLLAALVLLTVHLHFDGRRPAAAVALYAGILLRPELLPFWLVYGGFVWLTRPRARVPLLVGLAIVPLLTVGPDAIGSGNWMRSAQRAAIPSEGGPLLTGHPGLAVLQSAASALIVPVLVGAALALVLSARSWLRQRADGPTLALCGLGAGALIWEALLTQLHKSAGDQRYLIVGYTLACVVAGIGWVRLVRTVSNAWPHRAVAARLVPAVVVVAVAPFVIGQVVDWPTAWSGMTYQVHKDGQLQAIIRQLGRRQLLACGRILADTYQGASLAWYLDVPISRITVVPPPPSAMSRTEASGSLFRTANLGRTETLPVAPTNPAFSPVAQTTQWDVLSTCHFVRVTSSARTRSSRLMSAPGTTEMARTDCRSGVRGVARRSWQAERLCLSPPPITPPAGTGWPTLSA